MVQLPCGIMCKMTPYTIVHMHGGMHTGLNVLLEQKATSMWM